MKKYINIFVKVILPLALGLYLFWYFFSSMSDEHIHSFKKALSEANYFWVFLAMILEFISLWSRAYRWKYMLEPMGFKSSWSNRYHAMMIGYLANYTLPRAGEPVRSAMLFRSDGIPFAKSFGTIVSERVIDVIMLLLIATATILLGHKELTSILTGLPEEFNIRYDKSPEISPTIKSILNGVFITLFIGTIVLLFISKTVREKLRAFFLGFLNGVSSIFKTRHPYAFIGHTFLIWLCWILMFILPFYSLKETSNIPLSGMMLGFMVGTVGMSFTNGGIGVYPLLVGFAVAVHLRADYPQEAIGIGNALGMIIWIGNTAIMILLGLISLVLLPKNYTKNTKNDNTFRQSAQ